MKTKKSAKTSRGAFSLVEVCLAVGITGVCVATMQGLLPAGIRIARDSTEQTACATMLSSVASDLRYTPSSSAISPNYGITLPASGQGGETSLFLSGDGSMVSDPGKARFGVTVSITNAPSTTVSSLSTARIKVFWPAQSSGDKPQRSVETITSFNRAMQLGGVYRAKVVHHDDQSETSTSGSSSSGGSGSDQNYSKSGSCNDDDDHCDDGRGSRRDRDDRCDDDRECGKDF
jgi:uncharacterized protein (TIGR02598 family)